MGPWLSLGQVKTMRVQWKYSPRDPAWRERSCSSVIPKSDRSNGRFSELVGPCFVRSTFPNGAVLLTGAGVVPPDSFTLEARDSVRIIDLRYWHFGEPGRRRLTRLGSRQPLLRHLAIDHAPDLAWIRVPQF